jgi:tetratricopeptide (TPR) repeat protein
MELEDRAVAAVLDMLRLGLQAPERRALTAHGTQVAPAYEAYLQGRGYLRDYDRPENVDSAVESFRRALRLDSNYAAAHAALGEAYWKKYEIQKDKQWIDYAQRSCEQALSLDPKLAAAHICLGTRYRETGAYEKAVVEFNKALESEPTSDDAYRGLAAAYERLGRFEDAEKTFQRAINLRPQYWAGYSWLGAFYAGRTRYPDSARMFARVIELAPENVRGYRNLGGVYIEMGRYLEAIAVLERSNAIRPDPAAYNNLGSAYFRLRQFAKSTEYYRRALGQNERDFAIWGNLGDSYYWTPGKREQAMAAYQQAMVLAKENLAVNPRDARALSTQAKCHARLGEKDAALRCLQQALSLAPSSASVLFTAALVYGQFGQTDQTLESVAKALAAGLRPIRLRDDPSFDDLRNNQRFQQLISGQQSGKSEGR